MTKKTEEKTEETTEVDQTPGPVLTRLIAARNYARKHRVLFVTAMATTGLAIVTASNNTKLRAKLDDCEAGCETESEDYAELVESSIEDDNVEID